MRYKEEEEGGEGEGVEDIQLLETSLQQENEQVRSNRGETSISFSLSLSLSLSPSGGIIRC